MAAFLLWSPIKNLSKGFLNGLFKHEEMTKEALQIHSIPFWLPCKEESQEHDKKDLKKKEISNQWSLKSDRQSLMETLRKHPIDLILKDIKGKLWNLRCYQDKKNLIINLWATWCAPCIEELLSLSLMAEKTKDHALVLAISTESKEVLTRFIKRSFPDLKGNLKIVSLKKEVLNRYFPEDPLPVTYVFNKQGKLSVKISGARDWIQPELLENVKNPL